MSDFEIVVTSAKLKEVYDDMRVQADREALDRVWDYNVHYYLPYINASSKLDKAIYILVERVVTATRLNELKVLLVGTAGKLNQLLTDVIECHRQANLENDLSYVITSVAKIDALLINFTSDPTDENRKALKKELADFNSEALNNLADLRVNLPKIGRPSGMSEERQVIAYQANEAKRIHGDTLSWNDRAIMIMGDLRALKKLTYPQTQALEELTSRDAKTRSNYVKKAWNDKFNKKKRP